MVDLNTLFKAADWQTEKHAPAIDIDMEEDPKGIKIKVMVGKEIAHPNTTAHHIAWIDCYFLPADENFAVHVGKAEFNAHGASAQGADTSTLYTRPSVSFVLNTEKSGTVIAFSYCNIHGLWQSELEVTVE
jgi:superoxide reductase